ncbi:uncharacterized protein NEMAJ01_1236 [Nematocida major]|uniref:uncharacterized protein n=1 Tax=Nematocida major TaxID=1912982 RepID=UPI002008C11A|nr:uncharacterized protein NEMAJ01_1236 [Nematocida major]KAH9386340.1 hypothetical protein NEMAJ01_1236 [Nematocida major]
MEHTPSFSCIQPIEGIQTANKNVYSYFMKNDNSYYVAPQHRYTGYKKSTDKTYVVVISKYESATGDYAYTNNSSAIQMECLIGESKSNVQQKSVHLSNLFHAIKEIEYSLPGTEEIRPGDIFVGLVYPDGMNRVSIMNMVDSVLRHAGFKGILVLPMALALSLGLGVSNSVVYSPCDQTFALIEDNCMFDSFTVGRKSSSTLYGSDIVEEFLKKEEPPKSALPELTCFMCGAHFEISEFSMHFLNKHMIDIYEDQAKSDAMLSKCALREEPAKEEPAPEANLQVVARAMVRRLSPAERSKKVTATVILVTEKHIPAESAGPSAEGEAAAPAEGEGTDDQKAVPEDVQDIALIVEDLADSTLLYVQEKARAQTAWNGMFALTKIEPSKDLWLTDKEWKSVGLRVLKEKVLFFI